MHALDKLHHQIALISEYGTKKQSLIRFIMLLQTFFSTISMISNLVEEHFTCLSDTSYRLLIQTKHTNMRTVKARQAITLIRYKETNE